MLASIARPIGWAWLVARRYRCHPSLCSRHTTPISAVAGPPGSGSTGRSPNGGTVAASGASDGLTRRVDSKRQPCSTPGAIVNHGGVSPANIKRSLETQPPLAAQGCCQTGPWPWRRAQQDRRHVLELTLKSERESDGRWLAEVPELPGVLAYGQSPPEAMAKAEVLALRVLADRLEHGEVEPVDIRISVPAAA